RRLFRRGPRLPPHRAGRPAYQGRRCGEHHPSSSLLTRRVIAPEETQPCVTTAPPPSARAAEHTASCPSPPVTASLHTPLPPIDRSTGCRWSWCPTSTASTA